jgi:hypothetical protein
VGREVVRTKVSLGFDDPTDPYATTDPADKQLAQKIGSDTFGIAIVKAVGKDLHASHSSRPGTVVLPKPDGGIDHAAILASR